MIPTVSVIIPAYNVEQYITECINSVLSQTFQDWELIIIDDGSTDNTKNISNRFAVNDSRIRVLSQPNSGQSKARNNGLAVSQGKYIMFLDSDDWFTSKVVIEELVSQIETTQADFIQGGFEFVNEGHHKPYHITNIGLITGNEPLIRTLKVDNIYTYPCAKIYNHQFLRKNNLTFMEGLVNEDTAFAILVSAFASKVGFSENSIISVRERSGSTSRANFKRMFSTMHEVLMRTQGILAKYGKWDKDIERMFRIRYLRSMIYNICQSAQRMNYKTFKEDVEYCRKNTDYIQLGGYVAGLPTIHKVCYHLSNYTLVCFCILKFSKYMGFKMH